jgi:hypothetical protein
MVSPSKRPRRHANPWVGLLFIALMIGAGLLLNTDSTLTLTRDPSGAVTAVNEWRYAGLLTLLRRTVTHLRDARIQEVNLSERDRRSSANRNVFGMLEVPEELVLRGDSELAYPYRDDLSLIRGFLRNPVHRETTLHHPTDIRRAVGSVILLTLGLLSLVGWVVKLILGRDPLAGLPKRVKPLPPAVGGMVFLAIVGLGWGFFAAGHRLFGPVADSKVRLLLASAQNNDAAGVEQAIQRGVYLDVRDGQGMTALHLAARTGSASSARALLQAGARTDPIDDNETTPLLWAIQMGHPELAQSLMEAGADPTNADANGRTALHLAAQQGQGGLLPLLLRAGAEVNRADLHGWTPLFFAAASNSAETVWILLEAGADVRRRLPDGRTPADLAQGNRELQDQLRRAGAG